LNVTYEYDAVGNIKKKTQAIAYGGGASTTYITRYFFDDANRIEYIDYDWTTTGDVHYVYDPTGQRVKIEYGQLSLSGEDFSSFSASTSRGFVCMGGSILEEWTVSGSSLNTLAYRYVRNPATDLGGGIGSIMYQVDGTDYRYYHYNHKGDTGALTDANTDICAWYEYDAWGNVITEWELPTTQAVNGVENEFRFSTKQWDATPADATGTAPDAGLIYFGARSLDPSLGRWTQMDPAGLTDGLNAYLYARCNPLSHVDPNGEEIITVVVTTMTLGKATQHAILCLVYLHYCNRCIGEFRDIVRMAGEKLNDEQLAEWLRANEGSLEEQCGEVCRQAGKHGVRVVVWLAVKGVAKYLTWQTTW
ncbi:MAG: hypothetical protein JW889_08015, partial [Verrucomicrobia bacterium]|nr:hypothetical protein [Verrucomicrobiota bacterium]